MISEEGEKETVYKHGSSFFLIASSNDVDVAIHLISDDTAKGLKEFAKTP